MNTRKLNLEEAAKLAELDKEVMLYLIIKGVFKNIWIKNGAFILDKSELESLLEVGFPLIP